MVPEKKIFAYLIAASLVLPVACRYETLRDPAPFVHEVESGRKFSINLPEDHTRGEMWSLRDDYDDKVVERLSEVWHGNEKGIDFNFKALAGGTVHLHFVKRKFSDTIQTVDYQLKITDY